MAAQTPPRPHPQSKSSGDQRIVITGIDVPFVDWVTLLIKITIASIPAAIILGFFMFMLGLGFSMLGVGLGALLK